LLLLLRLVLLARLLRGVPDSSSAWTLSRCFLCHSLLAWESQQLFTQIGRGRVPTMALESTLQVR